MQDDPQAQPLQEMLSRLSPEELEIAAATSYDYFQNPTLESREQHATTMARRYLKSKKTVPRALKGMKATIQFRRDHQIDDLRTAFDNHNHNNKASTKLQEMLASRKNFVMGYDKDGRSTFHFIPARTQHHDLEWTLKESLYTMERAIACSKALASTTGSINAVIDFQGFDFWQHTPPLEVGKQFLTTLRCHYVGHFHKIFLVNVPLTFEVVWKIFENFVGTSTRQKIVVVSANQKEQVLGEWYSVEEAAPWMMEGGKKDRDLDLQEYLYKTPFRQAFDE